MDPSYISSTFEALGLGLFIFYLIRGLNSKIHALRDTVEIQSKTLDVMEKRIQETEKVGEIYRNLMSDLPQDLDNFKTILSKTKDETILELKNQQEITQQKLAEAQRQIKKSRNNPEVIERNLKVLKNILSDPPKNVSSFKAKYDIAQICEYGSLTLEQCVPLLISSKTVEEFLEKVGFDVEITDDKSVIRTVFSSSGPRTTPKGQQIQNATSSSSITGGWHLIANNEFYMNKTKLSELKDEFSSIKTIV